MTKQELIKMTGSEEQAAYAMEILLKNCKKPFVEMAIRAELNEIEKQAKAFEEEGVLVRPNGTYCVNWGAPNRERCYEADALLYRRNRTVSLLAAR